MSTRAARQGASHGCRRTVWQAGAACWPGRPAGRPAGRQAPALSCLAGVGGVAGGVLLVLAVEAVACGEGAHGGRGGSAEEGMERAAASGSDLARGSACCWPPGAGVLCAARSSPGAGPAPQPMSKETTTRSPGMHRQGEGKQGRRALTEEQHRRRAWWVGDPAGRSGGTLLPLRCLRRWGSPLCRDPGSTPFLMLRTSGPTSSTMPLQGRQAGRRAGGRHGCRPLSTSSNGACLCRRQSSRWKSRRSKQGPGRAARLALAPPLLLQPHRPPHHPAPHGHRPRLTLNSSLPPCRPPHMNSWPRMSPRFMPGIAPALAQGKTREGGREREREKEGSRRCSRQQGLAPPSQATAGPASAARHRHGQAGSRQLRPAGRPALLSAARRPASWPAGGAHPRTGAGRCRRCRWSSRG